MCHDWREVVSEHFIHSFIVLFVVILINKCLLIMFLTTVILPLTVRKTLVLWTFSFLIADVKDITQYWAAYIDPVVVDSTTCNCCYCSAIHVLWHVCLCVCVCVRTRAGVLETSCSVVCCQSQLYLVCATNRFYSELFTDEIRQVMGPDLA